ncbi:hypothetical protein [Ruminiclostridium papyrosolvens]|uniref:Uncharacterized protein n=1 Tax=Ruminiclostridium papyrosolvens C7 TaxID=1330534 RepID=U4R1E3_9FIRM|nr:hypothetical protein [Ruminiclostridium papyrosolvens]EPR12033.1 hypothetical protein L323_09765 [Ruminiclostridium papyrosolvens C7]
MLYEIFDYYKKDLRIYNLVIKHFKFWFYCLIVLPLICGSIYIYISYFYKLNFEIGFFASILLPYLLLFIIVNKKAKKTVKRVYNVEGKGVLWNTNDVLRVIRKHEKELLINYIHNICDVVNEDDIKELSDRALVEADNLKTKFPIIPSFFAALFISLWNNFLSWIYKYENVKDFDSALEILIFATLFIFMVIGIYIMFSSLYVSIREELIDSEHRKMKSLSRLLKEICDDQKIEKRRSNSISTYNNSKI